MIPSKKSLQELLCFQVSTSHALGFSASDLSLIRPLSSSYWNQRLSLSLASFLDFDWDSSFRMLSVPAALGYDLEWEDCWRLNRSALVPAKDSFPLSVKDLQLSPNKLFISFLVTPVGAGWDENSFPALSFCDQSLDDLISAVDRTKHLQKHFRDSNLLVKQSVDLEGALLMELHWWVSKGNVNQKGCRWAWTQPCSPKLNEHP